jgi:hypothetical protein
MATIVWKGREVAAKMAAAAVLGVEKTMADCVSDAKADHPPFPPASLPYERYANRTGFETGAIRSNGAKFDGRRAVGTWGAYTNYALFLEIGTSIAGPTATEREITGGGDMDAIPPPIGPLMAPRPFLRPAGDKEYPLLATRIGAAFRGEEMP